MPPIAYISKGGAQQNYNTSHTLVHTKGALANWAFVGMSFRRSSGTISGLGITYAGIPMVFVNKATQNYHTDVHFYELEDPAGGPQNIVGSWTGSARSQLHVSCFSNVGAIGLNGITKGSGDASCSVTLSDGDAIVNMCSLWATTPVKSGAQTLLTSIGAEPPTAGGYLLSPGTVSWTLSMATYAQVAVSMLEAPTPGQMRHYHRQRIPGRVTIYD